MTVNMIGLVVVLASVSGCVSTVSQTVDHEACRPAAAATLVGKPVGDDASIVKHTGGTIVRRIAPGDATTKDYRIERITVTVADGRVVAASCG